MVKNKKLNPMEQELIGLALPEVKKRADIEKIKSDLEDNLLVINNPDILKIFEKLATMKCDTFNL